MKEDELLDRLVPFHLALDRDLRIRHAGRGIASVLGPELAGRSLLDVFAFDSPATNNPQALVELTGSRLVCRARDGTLRMIGQMIDLGEHGYLLAATPWLTSASTFSGSLVPTLAAPHEQWADAFFNKQLVEQQRRDLERLVAELEDRSAQLRAIIDSAADAIITIDEQGTILRINPAGERLFGRPARELHGQSLAVLMPDGPDGRKHQEYVDRFLRTGIARVIGIGREVVGRRADGSSFEAELTLSEVSGTGRARFMGIIRDISERKRAESQIRDQAEKLRAANVAWADLTVALEAARTQAEAASEAKSLILANVSHEIRTPMNAVMGMTGLLLESELTAAQREYSATIRSSTEALLTVVNDLIDFSRIESGRMTFEVAPLDPCDTVEDVMAMLQPRAEVKGLKLAFVSAADVPALMMGDAARIRQILLNLVDNAIKFTPQGEVVVRLSVTPDGRALSASVTDTGIGIPDEVLPRLFRAFEQGDQSATRLFGGTGLGLALSRRLADGMGGTLGVESAVGEGSRFELTLPLKRVETKPWRPLTGVPAAVVSSHEATNQGLRAALRALGTKDASLEQARLVLIDDDRRVVDEVRDGLDSRAAVIALAEAGRSEQAPAGVHLLHRPLRRRVLGELSARLLGLEHAGATQLAPGDDEPVSGPPLRILVAEDNPVNQRVVRLQLERQGHHVETVADGAEALEALALAPYDVLLLDLHMPVLDGIAVALAVRDGERQHGHDRLAIVALTANVLPEERERCLAAGMDDVLWKPVTEAALAACLKRVAPEHPTTEPLIP